jgi:hypothetical protein
MGSSESKQPPALATWAEVEPARFPFDSREMPGVLRTILVSLPLPERPEDQPLPASVAWDWVCAVGDALAGHYGPWAYHWDWGLDQFERAGWVLDRIPEPAEAPAFVARNLVAWRGWLETLAGLFDELQPQLNPERAGDSYDVVAAWQLAIARLMKLVDARTVDGDDWQGWCRRSLQWFLTANDVPAEQAQALVSRAIGARFETWRYLTETDIVSVSEQLAKDALVALGVEVPPRTENWPDTWPHNWPSWRATNTGWISG